MECKIRLSQRRPLTLPWLRRTTATKLENLRDCGHIVFGSGDRRAETGDRLEFEGIGMLRISQNQATTEILQSENKSMSV